VTELYTVNEITEQMNGWMKIYLFNGLNKAQHMHKEQTIGAKDKTLTSTCVLGMTLNCIHISLSLVAFCTDVS